MHARDILNRNTLLKALSLGAGLLILAVGIAIAQPVQGDPPPSLARPVPGQQLAPLPDARQAVVEQCRREVEPTLVLSEMRERMRRCIEAKREAAGLNQRDDRRQARAATRASLVASRDACRAELKDQRFTEAERRDAMQACVAKSNPQFARALSCRKEAEAKKLERRSPPFREFMRSCVRAT